MQESGQLAHLPAELVGTWAAEPACLPHCGFTLTSVADPADSLNATAWGLTTEISMTAAGAFRLSVRPGPDTASTAAVRAEGATLIVTDPAGAVDTLDYSLNVDLLTLRFRRVFTVVDFNDDGVADPAHARGTFRKR